MKVTILIDNGVLPGRKDLCAEHGLSIHIEHCGRQILFDTGASDTFAHNAERLGIDLRAVDAAVISHHHLDHGGGLARFLATNTKARTYMRGSQAAACFFKAFGVIRKSAGLDPGLFREYADRIEFVEGFTEILPDVFILTEIEETYPRPKGNRYLFVQKDGAYIRDRFEHELLLVLREREELAVFTSCSHQGVLNMVDAATRRFEGLPVKALFGGFHLIGLPIANLMAAGRNEVTELGLELRRRPIRKIYTGHCTGTKGYGILQGILGDRLEYAATGCSYEI